MPRGTWLTILGTILLTTANARGATLHALVEARVKPENHVDQIESERTWAVSGYNPVQFFEYRYGREYEDNKRYYRIPFSNEGGETHTVRIHIKSPQEILQYGASRELSRQLLESERSETSNQQQFDAYLDLTQEILNARMLGVLSARQNELKKSVENNGSVLGHPDADMKDLVAEMAKLQEVDSEQLGVKAQGVAIKELSAADVEATAQSLIDNVPSLAKKIPEIGDAAATLQTERRRVELKLKRIDNEIKWSEDRKIIDHIDLQRDSLERSDGFRIAFNVPFLRFDNETRAREKALLVASEREAEREAREINSQLRRKRAEVYSLAAQVESMRSRLIKTRLLARKTKGMTDIELKAVLGDFGFEIERDVLLQSLKFYEAYLEYLRDTGAFARFSGSDLLDPKWQAVK